MMAKLRMLDLNHPQTQFVFDASGIEEKIRPHLLAWLDNARALPNAPCNPEVVKTLIPQLHALNVARFNAKPGITETLNTLQSGVESGSAKAAWGAYLDLAEHHNAGNNFGTWMI
jgi:hypothetical protein